MQFPRFLACLSDRWLLALLAAVFMFGCPAGDNAHSLDGGDGDDGSDAGRPPVMSEEPDAGIDAAVPDGKALDAATAVPDVGDAATEPEDTDPAPVIEDERCDGQDQDADGFIDEGLSSCVPSCAEGAVECKQGDVSISCCASPTVEGGAFSRGRCGDTEAMCSDAYDGSSLELPAQSVTVSDFALDTFEVTIGRFRRFFDAYAKGWRPRPGEGAHPHLQDSGWQAAWDELLPSDAARLKEDIRCTDWSSGGTVFHRGTYHDLAPSDRPMDCVNWYEAFAFCAWDGGRLPTESEWEYAAAGGDEDRLYPWGAQAPDDALAAPYCINGDRRSGCPEHGSALPVGSRPLGNARYGQSDLAGGMTEWVLDQYAAYPSEPMNVDDANIDLASAESPRASRGGVLWSSDVDAQLRAASRDGDEPSWHAAGRGFRCARATGGVPYERHACRTNPTQECLALASLKLSQGYIHFAPETEQYSVALASSASTVQVTAIGRDGQRVRINGRVTPAGQSRSVALVVGLNTIEIDVFVGDLERRYTVHVTRASPN